MPAECLPSGTKELYACEIDFNLRTEQQESQQSKQVRTINRVEREAEKETERGHWTHFDIDIMCT